MTIGEYSQRVNEMFKTIFDSMEAPDKIYRHQTTGDIRLNSMYYEYKPAKIRYNDKIIEYIRKDAFIEKLTEFLDKDYLIKTKCPLRWVPVNKVIENFKNYIK